MALKLLELGKARFPRTVRIILSGQSDRETILRSVDPSHQYLSKPCGLEELKQRLMSAFALRDMLDDPPLAAVLLVAQTRTCDLKTGHCAVGCTTRCKSFQSVATGEMSVESAPFLN